MSIKSTWEDINKELSSGQKITGIDFGTIQDIPNNSDSLLVTNEDGNLTIEESDYNSMIGVKGIKRFSNKKSEAQLVNKLDSKDNDFIIEKLDDEYIVKEIDKISKYSDITGNDIQEYKNKYSEVYDGSNIKENVKDDLDTYIENQDHMNRITQFEKYDRKMKQDKLQSGDPTSINDNRLRTVVVDDQVIIVKSNKDKEHRIEKDIVAVPDTDKANEYTDCIRTSLGRRTALNGAPVEMYSKEEIKEMTGVSSLNKSLQLIEESEPETIKEFVDEDMYEKEPTDLNMWDKFLDKDTEKDSNYMPSRFKFSEIYNIQNQLNDGKSLKDIEITKEQVLLTFSTKYFDDKETAKKLIDEIEKKGSDIELEDIEKHLPEKVRKNRLDVARKILPRLDSINKRFEIMNDEENGKGTISLSNSPVIGTGYSTYIFLVVQKINGKTYVNGPYYQSSYRDNSNVSRSNYHPIRKSFDDYEDTIKSIN